MGVLEDILDALDYPLRKTKEAVSGDEREWLAPKENPSELDHHLYAGLNTAADLALDPLNFIGAGGKALQAANKTARKIPGAIGSFSNYIPNWYGPGNPIPNKFDEVVGSVVGDPSAVSAGRQWVQGAGSFLGDSMKSAAHHVLSPTSRALWDDYGQTVPANKRIRGLLDLEGVDVPPDQAALIKQQYKEGLRPSGSTKVDSRAQPKAMAQEIYNEHIVKQTGHVPKYRSEAADALQERWGVTDYLDADADQLAEAFTKNTTTMKIAGGQVVEVGLSPEDAKFMAENILIRQGAKSTDKVVMKAPAGIDSGGHFSDLVVKNPANSAISKVFKEFADESGNVPLDTLKKQLKAMEQPSKGRKGLAKLGPQKSEPYWTLTKTQPSADGVWLQGGKTGTAIVEGGVPFFMKLEVDGTMKVFMHDKHDFFEKALAGAEKANNILAGSKATSVLDTGVVAVSPPMISNIKTVATIKGAKVRDAAGEIIKTPTGKGGRSVNAKQDLKGAAYTPVQSRFKQANPEGVVGNNALLRQYANQQPTAETLARAQRELAGEGLLGTFGALKTGQAVNANNE